MTWETFTNAIYSAKFVHGNAPEILVSLFRAAGTMAECNKTATQKWISGSRNCKSSKYFPDGKLNNVEDTYKFFRNRPDSKLQDLQNKFRSLVDADSPIDVNTENMDVFCWSLVNQFLDLLEFQRLEIPSGNSSGTFEGNAPQDNPAVAPATSHEEKGDKEATHSPPQEPLYKCFVSAVAGFPMEKFLDSDPADSLADYLIRDAVTFWGRINAGRNQEDTPDRTTETYQIIICFIDALKDYLGFLMVNSVRPNAFPDDFHLISSDGEIADKANSHRKRAKGLFNAALEAAQEKVAKERTDVIHTGEYSPPSALNEYWEKFRAT